MLSQLQSCTAPCQQATYTTQLAADYAVNHAAQLEYDVSQGAAEAAGAPCPGTAGYPAEAARQVAGR